MTVQLQILIVEDERIVAEDIKRQIKKLGYAACSIASTGEEAIERAGALTPDLVLMDIVLPGDIDGVEAAETIRSRYDIPVVYLTAYADSETLQRAKLTDPYGYITKPFEVRDLETTIEIALHRHTLDRKLRESEEWLATTLRSVRDAVIATDEMCRVKFSNFVAVQLTGWLEEESRGKELEEVLTLVDEQSRESVGLPIRRTLEEGHTFSRPRGVLVVSREGGERPVAVTGAPIRDEMGRVHGSIVVFRDTTLDRRREDEILRTQKLESAGVMATGIAHDFSNLLTIILGNVSLAKSRLAADTEAVSILSKAESAALQTINLTQQFLSLAEVGGPVTEPAPLADVVRQSAGFALRGANVDCHFTMPADLRPVGIEAAELSRVVNNLIINAGQAMPEGGILDLAAQNVTVGSGDGLPVDNGPFVKLTVRDSGVGIPRRHLTRIFDPYFSTKQQGSGLGLATVYSIVHNRGGYVAVESELGVGTCFTLYLPACPEAEAAQSANGVGITRGCGRILVMDDDEQVLDVCTSLLADLGYFTATARDGEETLERYLQARQEGVPFDAVIIDLSVRAGLGGRETIEKLLYRDPDARVLLSAGNATDPLVTDYRAIGLRGVVMKPYRLNELSSILSSCLTSDG